MPWAKFDDGAAFHPKILDAGNECAGAWWRMVVYSAGALTDGRISRRQALAIALAPGVIDRLLAVGLLDADGTGGGYLIHDFGDYNPTGPEAEQARAKRKQAAAKAARARWGFPDAEPHAPTDAEPHAPTDAEPHAPTDAEPMRQTCPVPDPVPATDPIPPLRGGRARQLKLHPEREAPKKPDAYQAVLGRYSEAYQAVTGQAPVILPPDRSAVGALLSKGRPGGTAPEAWPAELADLAALHVTAADAWVVAQGYRLRDLPGRLNRLRQERRTRAAAMQQRADIDRELEAAGLK